MNFWRGLETLRTGCTVVIDRPKGSAHPRCPDMIYPLDYGFLDSTHGGDGAGVDVWLGSGNRTHLNGVICTVDVNKRDAEIKLLLGCTAEEMQTVVDFLTSNDMGCWLIPHPLPALLKEKD